MSEIQSSEPRFLTTNQIREMYLSFFESKGHLRYPSHPIPVYNDPTIMFSVAGMAQFKPYFLGAEPKFEQGVYRRVVTAQKCIRIGDIENVGRTSRHCSLFEMLGNFSFDSYFKKEAIEWAWEFITDPKWLGYDGSRIYVTIYKDDEEAFEYWTKNVGLPASHINRFDADENFWPQNAPSKGPNGPCGPCSEIFYDRGEKFGSDTWEDYAKNPESDRFLEFWNLVFPGYNRTDGADGTGSLEDLGKKNIDTGLGMIRAAFISQDVEDLFDTDDFKPLIAEVEKLSGKKYEGISSLSHRVIAEHIRMVSMTLADGVSFGISEREYVVRKVMRRASRHAYLLGMKEPVLFKLVQIVVDTLGQAYPEMVNAQESVTKQIEEEEKRFLKTLENGIKRLSRLLAIQILKAGAEEPQKTPVLNGKTKWNLVFDSIYYGVAKDIYSHNDIGTFDTLVLDVMGEITTEHGYSPITDERNRPQILGHPGGYEVSKVKPLRGEDAFILYDTFGFPLDLTKEIAEEQGLSVDESGFDLAFKEAQNLARAGSKYGKKDGMYAASNDSLEGLPATNFVGYNMQNSTARVVAILVGNARVLNAHDGDHVQIILDTTPFYAEGGGQVGDVGVLEWTSHHVEAKVESPIRASVSGHVEGRAVVTGTHKNAQGIFIHEAQILRGTLSVEDTLEARVESGVRAATEKHHTATHLLQAALRATLGSHVQQKGSLVSPDRLRFDFTHNEAVTGDEIRHVEQLVNRWIQADFAVSSKLMPLEEARKTGAMALFGEKYGAEVRVVSVDGAISSVGILEQHVDISSKELCGGTHVSSTGKIGAFVIVSEEGTAAGIRRLEALCGEAATAYVRDTLERVRSLSRTLNATPETLPERLEKLQDEMKVLNRTVADLKQKLVHAQTSAGSSADNLELGGFKIARLALTGVVGNELRTAVDDLLEKSKADIVVVGSEGGLAIKATKDAVARGAHAGQLIGKLAAAGGGKGGGRPDMAQAGVKDVKAALEALETAF
jgi:alanyl-tRNA synthetase